MEDPLSTHSGAFYTRGHKKQPDLLFIVLQQAQNKVDSISVSSRDITPPRKEAKIPGLDVYDTSPTHEETAPPLR